ncbi:TetR family transcriptional regulator [Microlunatus elymi]|uniref:TetR family transcriptional regulator n=1 Tax=Microlunatus elymi TaxID=2596828 RepID=A0A516Q465_9ACTN|nr:TetR family transcriptional regulator [Microlunatus elymi]QDP98236.1 TetR family transcriptional regulator [Microlunatus elymi]
MDPGSKQAPPLSGARLGLRERKKLATRQSVQAAALQLALERGVDRVTVEEICKVAEIAPRTFFNHFAGKDEALVGDIPPDLDQAALERIRDGRPDRLWDDLGALLLSYAPRISVRREEFLARRRMLQHPSLMPRVHARFAALEQSLIEAIAFRTGTDPTADAYPQMVAGMTVTAMKVAMRRWTSAADDRPLEDYIDESIAALRSALSV